MIAWSDPSEQNDIWSSERYSNPNTKKTFLVEKGTFKGKPISVRGIQKRMEYYARKAGVKASSHQLRHTMATQLLNADMDRIQVKLQPLRVLISSCHIEPKERQQHKRPGPSGNDI